MRDTIKSIAVLVLQNHVKNTDSKNRPQHHGKQTVLSKSFNFTLLQIEFYNIALC